MTSLSTRFLGQPRLMKPTFKRVHRPYGRIFIQDSIEPPAKALPAAAMRRLSWRNGEREGLDGSLEETSFYGGVRVGYRAGSGGIGCFHDHERSHVLRVVG